MCIMPAPISPNGLRGTELPGHFAEFLNVWKAMVPSRFPLWKGALLSSSIAVALGIPTPAQTQSTAQPLITRPVDESSLVTLRGNVHPLARPQFDRGPAPV